MGRIDQETVQRILDAADIVDVVSDFVKLRRSGANFKGLCPFHNERTPSFSVNKARNICKCFSCGKGGSPVNFIMELEQLSYQEALRYLARKYNIEIVEKDLSPEERQAASDREAMLAVNDFAIEHFEHNLRGTEEGRTTALAYLHHRGLSDEMIRRFRLGYSLEHGNELVKSATDAGYQPNFLQATGLAIESKGNLYDRFKGRVIYPVFSISGRVVAFGGRTMKSDKTIAKYVNSPESIIYKKSNELYGLFQAKSAISKKNKCIMVEGYMDVISMHQSGVENVVASSGTSLTDGQIRAIHRFTDNVTLIYDADPAGIKASLRGIKMLLSEKINVRCLLLPEGEDPDSFAQAHSSEEVEGYLEANEKDIVTFMAEVLLKGVAPNDPIERSKVVTEIIRTIACVDEPVKSQAYITLCSQLLGMPEEVIARQLKIEYAKRFEELEKEKYRAENRKSIESVENSVPETAPQGPVQIPESVPTTPINYIPEDLRPYEEMIVRYLVRYGMLTGFDISIGGKLTEGATVYDFVEAELSCENYKFAIPEFNRVYQVVGRLRHSLWENEHNSRLASLQTQAQERIAAEMEIIRTQATSVADAENRERNARAEVNRWLTERIDEFDAGFVQSHLVNSDDDIVRRVANDLMTEKYVLSKIYNRADRDESEQSNLHILVPRAIHELRNALLTKEIKELTKTLSTIPASDGERAAAIINDILSLKSVQTQLLKELGERIILPK